VNDGNLLRRIRGVAPHDAVPVALSALPAVWVGYQSSQIAEGLADLPLSKLGLDLVYLCRCARRR
jgi:hypothetical protein